MSLKNENKAIAHRTLRYTISTQVLPSLKINAFTRPSTKSLNEFILGIEVGYIHCFSVTRLIQLTFAVSLH
jgi:trafficking protein particle complex subunit 8